MRANRWAAGYVILVGVSMLSMWLLFYLGNSIPELETEPMRILMHLLAEGLTAICLITSGVGLLAGRHWGRGLYLFSMGMLIYTLVQSPGYFIQTGDNAFAAMFAVLLFGALVFSLRMLRATDT
jgi:hypothetical protein